MGGLSKHTFLTFVQLYYKVVKDIALTDNFEVSACAMLRKLGTNEILEVQKGPESDEKLGAPRVYVKSMLDGVTGWVTLKGNQGTHFLEAIPKPFFACLRKGAMLDKEVKAEAGSLRELKEAEVLELIEGPQKVLMQEASRARVKFTKDNLQGWVTLRNKYGVTFAEPNTTLYMCKTTVAMTDGDNMQDSKVIAKLSEGDMFDSMGAEVKQDASGISRVKGKALKSGEIGWITTQGNAGTVFAATIPKYYSVLKEVEANKKYQPEGADVIRKLEVGETFQIMEGPKEEKASPESRIKVRAASDGVEGWVSRSGLKSWSADYKVLVSTALQDTRGATEVTKTIRELAKGEQFEYLDGPFEEGKELRMKGRAKKDGATGWVTLKDEKGQRKLEC